MQRKISPFSRNDRRKEGLFRAVCRLCGDLKFLVDRLELRQPDFRSGLLEYDRNFHAELHVFNRTLHDVRDHARPFVEIDPGDNVGDIRLEGFGGGTADDLPNDGERINLAFAARRLPFDFLATAFVARRARRPNPSATILTALNYEFLLRGGVPEGFSFRSNSRQW